VDYVFIPPEEEMYPPGYSSYVEVQKLGGELAGLPQILFRGFTTGTLKIMHLTKPAYTFFGEPDAIQGAILRKMVRDLNISTEVVTAHVLRLPSGLAYSGRNRLLTESQLAAAPVFYRILRAAENGIASGETNGKRIMAEMIRVSATEPMAKLDYAVIADPESLESVSRIQGKVIIGVGGKIGNVFLTDAILVGKNRNQELEVRSENVP
jgi:pantoate--beta-alanine ligase